MIRFSGSRKTALKAGQSVVHSVWSLPTLAGLTLVTITTLALLGTYFAKRNRKAVAGNPHPQDGGRRPNLSRIWQKVFLVLLAMLGGGLIYLSYELARLTLWEQGQQLRPLLRPEEPWLNKTRCGWILVLASSGSLILLRLHSPNYPWGIRII